MSLAEPQIDEQTLQYAIIEAARLFGWKVAHFRAARTARGWRTPVAADGKGFPDLVLCHPGRRRLIFAELKSTRGRLSAEQHEWLGVLGDVADVAQQVDVYLWTPDDWPDRVLEVLGP